MARARANPVPPLNYPTQRLYLEQENVNVRKLNLGFGAELLPRSAKTLRYIRGATWRRTSC